MHTTLTKATETEQSILLMKHFRRIWDALAVGGDADSRLLQLPTLQLRCLRRIGEQDGQRMVDIASKMQMPLPGASRLVDRLVRRGMVSRQSDPFDRRVVRVMLTDAGRAGLAEIDDKRRTQIENCLRYLDPKTVDHLLDALQLLSGAVERSIARE